MQRTARRHGDDAPRGLLERERRALVRLPLDDDVVGADGFHYEWRQQFDERRRVLPVSSEERVRLGMELLLRDVQDVRDLGMCETPKMVKRSSNPFFAERETSHNRIYGNMKFFTLLGF